MRRLPAADTGRAESTGRNRHEPALQPRYPRPPARPPAAADPSPRHQAPGNGRRAMVGCAAAAVRRAGHGLGPRSTVCRPASRCHGGSVATALAGQARARHATSGRLACARPRPAAARALATTAGPYLPRTAPAITLTFLIALLSDGHPYGHPHGRPHGHHAAEACTNTTGGRQRFLAQQRPTRPEQPSVLPPPQLGDPSFARSRHWPPHHEAGRRVLRNLMPPATPQRQQRFVTFPKPADRDHGDGHPPGHLRRPIVRPQRAD